jgi:4,5-dihydroxyphthalate decarboxylase
MMSELTLTLACNDYDRCRALFDGRVKPEGIRLQMTALKPRELFPRMLDAQEFMAGEVSLASYASLVARGTSPFVGIPVTLSKIFRHSCIYVRRDAGIARPEDLKGKRVGTTQYGATAIVYIKGTLNDEYSVAPEDMKWFVGGLNAPTEKPLIPLSLPKGVELEFLPEGKTLEAMLLAGELDALFSIYFPKIFLDGDPRIVRLFPNFRAVEQDYYRRSSFRGEEPHPRVLRGARSRRRAALRYGCAACGAAVPTRSCRRKLARLRKGFLGLWRRAEPSRDRGAVPLCA